MPQIVEEIREGFRSGRYISPWRAGVAYMLSGDVQVFDPQTGKLGSFPPHVMFYAPNVTNAAIGTTPEALTADPLLPHGGYQGPHGYIVMLVGNSASHQYR